MTQKKVGIIIIGNEILSGRTYDKNVNFIAKKLIKNGLELSEVRIIPDDQKKIIETVLDFHKKFSYVFTTGGIGPTHDDITTESISKAFKKKYRIDNRALKILKNFYSDEHLNVGRKKMAKLPEGCELILNPLTGAPGFKINNIYVLPGIPVIMKKMFLSILKDIRNLQVKQICTINTNLFESVMAKQLSNIQKKFNDCEIGSYPYFDMLKKSNRVNIVVSSWNKQDLSPVTKKIVKMISLLGGKSFIV